MRTTEYKLPQLLSPFPTSICYPGPREKKYLSSASRQLSHLCLSAPTLIPKGCVPSSLILLSSRQATPTLLALFPSHHFCPNFLPSFCVSLQTSYPDLLKVSSTLATFIFPLFSTTSCSTCSHYSNGTFSGYNLIKDTDPGFLSRTIFDSCLLHLEAGRCWAHCLIPLCISFLISKIRIIVVTNWIGFL